MVVRRQARFITDLDERILEYLDGESWAIPEEIAAMPSISASPAAIQERLRWLASIDFVAFTYGSNSDMVEITTDGILYLEGEVDSRLRKPSKRALREE